jgi:hypothetical protein
LGKRLGDFRYFRGDSRFEDIQKLLLSSIE